MADEGYREIHLTGKQLVFVFMAATVVAVVIFLLGVLVGRGVQNARPAAEPTLRSAPQNIPDTAPGPDASRPAPVDDGAAPVPPPADEFSYPARLDAKEEPAETLKTDPARASSANRAAPAPATTKGTPVPPPDANKAAPAPATTKTTPAPPPDAGKAAPASAKVPPPDEPAAADGAGLSVQVAAVKKRAEADAIVSRLQKKGYRAYVFTPTEKNPASMFRVRVGPFKSREEAEAAAHRLQQEEQYKPWIIR